MDKKERLQAEVNKHNELVESSNTISNQLKNVEAERQATLGRIQILNELIAEEESGGQDKEAPKDPDEPIEAPSADK